MHCSDDVRLARDDDRHDAYDLRGADVESKRNAIMRKKEEENGTKFQAENVKRCRKRELLEKWETDRRVKFYRDNAVRPLPTKVQTVVVKEPLAMKRSK